MRPSPICPRPESCRCEGQELFIEQALLVERGQQPRATLDKNPFSRDDPAHRIKNFTGRNLPGAPADRVDANQVGDLALEQLFRRRARL